MVSTFNTVLLKSGQIRFIDRLYLRADYSVSLLEDIIVNDGGRFRNSGTRLINSVEMLARLELAKDMRDYMRRSARYLGRERRCHPQPA